MVAVRHVNINWYRCIESLEWHPKPGVNALIGAGDSGKTTILDAIERTLDFGRSAQISETDFHRLDTSKPIDILVSLGDLGEELLAQKQYDSFFRGYDSATGKIYDEPVADSEYILTLRLTIGTDLIPVHRLYSERQKDEDPVEPLYKHRGILSARRLGVYARSELTWGRGSLISRIDEKNPSTAAALLKARISARQSFSEETGSSFESTLDLVAQAALRLAGPLGDKPLALLSMDPGRAAVSIHDANGVPAANLGTGSARLLVAALMHHAAGSNICLVDEIETGLEPHRITNLLMELGHKNRGGDRTAGEPQQVILTTHSPVVLRELTADQVHVVRCPREGSKGGHSVNWAGRNETRQKALRACAEAFLAPRILVCEGKTEYGFVRGIDQWSHKNGRTTHATFGVCAADGGGGEAINRALAFAELGYEVALFRDDDVPLVKKQADKLDRAGVRVISWPHGMATEHALFTFCPAAAIPILIQIAEETRGRSTIEGDVAKVTDGIHSLAELAERHDEEARGILVAASTRKETKGGAPRDLNWYKLIEPGERIASEVVCAHYSGFGAPFKAVIQRLSNWIRGKDIDAVFPAA